MFKPTSPERGKKTVKRPVGRPRKRPLQSDGQALPDNRELENIQAAPVHGEEPSVKSIRRQYTEKQKKRVVLYARHHGVRPTIDNEYTLSMVLSPEFWSGKFWSGGPKFSVENWSGRTDFFGENGPPLENWSE